MLSLRMWSAVALVGLAACAKPSEPVAPVAQALPEVKNPTGACTAPPGNGARPGHAPSWRYLPDCEPPLRREYYRVFAWSEAVASMFPRPDGAPGTAQICATEAQGTPLRALFERYTLCAEAPDIERVNKMTAADALAIGRALHERMRFVANGGDVRPFPYDDDVLWVCEQRPQLASGVLADRCAYARDIEQKRKNGEPIAEIYRVPPDAEGPPLAQALNELYGVTAE